MKETFEKVSMEIICFDAEDIIKTSNVLPDDVFPAWYEEDAEIIKKQ